MDEQYNTRVTCGRGNITLIAGLPCTFEDWKRCPFNAAGYEIGEKCFRKTIFDTVPVQIYLIQNVKSPIMEGARMLFSAGGLFDNFRALRQIFIALKALKKLPEPTRENTILRSARNAIDIRDRFFEHCHLAILRSSFIRLFFNLVIILLQMDGPWRMMILWVKREAEKMEGWEETGDDLSRFKWWKEESIKSNHL